MLCLDEATVCKPVVEKELEFYECLPGELHPFTPEYYGVIKVKVLPDGEYISLVGTAPNNYTPKLSSNFKRLRFRRSGSLEQDVGAAGMFEEDAGCNSHATATGMNPWVFRCHRDHLATLAATIEAKNTPQNFLVLENLTWKFRLPCILDLKMGTRQYDDNDSLAKRQRKMVKVVTTTSGKLGVRVGGMQVYQVTSGRFLCRNKFYGRTLSAGGFSAAVRHFLHDGTRLRVEVLPPLIRRLEALVDVLENQTSLRLYTTSLLLLYEGEPVQQPTDKLREKRESMERSSSLEDRAEDIDSDGSSSGLERSSSSGSLSAILVGKEVVTPEDRRGTAATSARKMNRRRSSSCCTEEISAEEPLTDVRIIDFAHSTHKGMSDSVVYSGPDNGFLFGLENMIAILKSIHRDYR
ncbi:hypothetical protein AAG570_013614 [Ranatra chinensis]|uniref:Kinase n=1 Tax=Ranatra chinensis TaxID=642074 RepID=A0ABD0YZ21_9HEMI